MHVLKLFYLTLLLTIATPVLAFNSIYHFQTQDDTPEILINGSPLKPVNLEKNLYQSLTLNTLGYNTITVGNQKQKFKLFKIRPQQTISFSVNSKTYNILTYPNDLQKFTINNKGSQNGIIATSYSQSPKGSKIKPTSYALLFKTDGEILFYHASLIDGYSIGDFQRHTLTNGEKRYAFMQRTLPLPPYEYWYGKQIVFDENFQKINELTQINENPDKRLIDNHDAIILGDNHYILPRYELQTKDKKSNIENIVSLTLQEIKNNKIIFEWKSGDYPETYEESVEKCHYDKKEAQDYMHLNSIEIDPKDNNLILSFRHTSSIYKIDRQTGKIIWKLGGKKDQFKLTPQQKFLFQHSVSLTSDGYLMLYDNQTTSIDTFCAKDFEYEKYPTSRILKFKLDEKNFRIVDFQEIKLPYLSEYMGNVYETSSGTYIVGYGSNQTMAGEEFDKNGKSLWTLKFPDIVETYRVIKYD